MGFDVLCISKSRVGSKKPHQNRLFLAEVMNFLKSGSQYNYYTNFTISQNNFRNIFGENHTNLVVIFLL